MSTPITHGELAELATQLPHGELRDWCVASGTGTPGTTVYADTEMLSRCFAAASSSVTEESNKTEESKQDEDVYGQPGGDLESNPVASENQKDAGIIGVGHPESDSLPANHVEPD